jgi:ABC-2 type transport system permease protein
MRNIWAIYKKEMRSYFVSPIAYIVLAFFTAIAGYFFYGLLVQFLEFSMRSMLQAQYYKMAPPKVNVNEMVVRPLFLNMSIIVLFILPAITMRLFSEEKKSGTIELILTSPITQLQTILGKFLSGLSLYACMILLTIPFIVILFIYGDPELGPVLTGYLGVFLFGGSFVAIGLLISSLTENQIVSAIATFGVLLILWVIDWMAAYTGPALSSLFTYISVIDHLENFAKGVIDSQDVIFYLSVMGFGLFLTYSSMESLRWRE